MDLVAALDSLIRELYPITRSITGDGVRETLRILGRDRALQIHEVPTATPVLDWTVPSEWVFRSATLRDPSGALVVDASRLNLHVLNYSSPLHGTFSREQLDAYLLSDPERPGVVPYRTSYYAERAALCISHDQRRALGPGDYELHIDTELRDGSLTYGEWVVPGRTAHEVLLSTHVCHPSLANDNCAGMALLATLMRSLEPGKLRHTVRALFVPGTIGSITWLARNPLTLSNIRHGLVLNNVGDRAPFTYKRSRRATSVIDTVAPDVVRGLEPDARVVEFEPYGYDERQFCSPGIDLPVGALSRSTYGYPEYHSSADDLTFVDPERTARSLTAVRAVLEALDDDVRYLNLAPNGEPQLGRRGLYSREGGQVHGKQFEMALLWMLSQSDGRHGLADISRRAGLAIEVLRDAATALVETGLLAELP